MITSYLKTTFRSLIANPVFTGLNVFGLIVGFSVMYLASGYLIFENSYDTFHENSEELYRVARKIRSQDYAVVGFNDSTAEEQEKQIETIKNITGIKNATQFMVFNEVEYLNKDGKNYEIKQVLHTNTPESFVKMFSWQILSGSLDSFYDSPNTVMLTESEAKRIFEQDISQVVGETVEIDGINFRIAAVIKDVPKNSHFDFQLALNQKTINYWGSHLYVQLAPKIDLAGLKTTFDSEMKKIIPRLANSEIHKGHFFQPITDIHLKSNILYELKTPGNIQYIYIIGIVGFLILVITIFNYTNFTLALKAKKSKTIGVRKVMGASSNNIVKQFVVEAIVLVILCMPVTFLLISVITPIFNEFMGVQLASNMLTEPLTLLYFVILALVFGVLSSIAPAFLLSKRKAITLFNEKLKEKSFQQFSLRKYLVISQFSILIGVTCVSYFMYQQIKYIEDKDVGYNSKNLIYTYSSEETLDLFQKEIRAIPGVNYVGNGSSFAIETFNNINYKIEDSDEVFSDSNQFYLDYDAIQAYQLKTTLSPEIFNSTEKRFRRTLINRSAAERFAAIRQVSPDNIIGMTVVTEPSYQNEDGTMGFPFTVDGIYEDINVFSLKENITSYFITVSDRVRMSGRSIVSVDASIMPEVVNKIKAIHSDLDEKNPLQIEYADNSFQELHKQDSKTANLIFILNFLATFLAFSGIIGITLLLVVGKTKEIGIRKILGASLYAILKLSVKEYISFIIVSFLIGAPIAWIVIRKWLSNFAYKVQIQPTVFLLVPLFTFLLIALVVGGVSFQAARANPVKSLRTE
ncbi:FtsX-like permease family protein [Spongiivirga sp. MCCC 1A20706]|uniref:ABC transporter permease n=1 Tax=Spongiivirga sp. MCCC 1A20706 TaxID=3160963 RepID=UPI00397739B8